MEKAGVIDFHTHAFPDSLALRAIAVLEAEAPGVKAFLDERVSSLLASMDRAGIEKSVVCSIATKPSQYRAILSWSREILMALRGEMGYPSALTAETWGFYDVLFKGKEFTFQRPYGSYVMEHVLFNISFPAEFHAQTAVECALELHPRVKDRLDDIEKIEISTHESAIRIIDKKGPLDNPADRDHCMQYMVAVGLIFGELTSAHYEDHVAADPRIDALREKMTCVENPDYTKDYLDPGKRSIANAIRIVFTDGSTTDRVEVQYPIGHRRRREEGIPVLIEKLRTNLARRFPPKQQQAILDLCLDQSALEGTAVHEFMDMFVI
jgi:2-methylcitrate dehydratase